MNPAAASPFYITGGTLRHDAPSYVERGADCELFDGLSHGEFCYVLTSRQMGKSSLMVRTANKLREHGIVVVALDLTAVGQNVSPEQWYHGLLMRIGRQLWAEDELERFWDGHPNLSPVQRFFSALRDVILEKDGASRILKPAAPLVIFVDEIDVVRSLPFPTDEFFAAIRECYNRRTVDPEFERLTFGLLGVATPSDLISDTRITPFNIGRRIELHDFTHEEAAPLAARLDPQLPLVQSRLLLDRVLFWTNGHPYLTQRLCHAVAQTASDTSLARVDSACMQLFFTNDARENDDNLIFVRERLLRTDEINRTRLLTLYKNVLARKRVASDRTNPLVAVLQLSGITRAEAGRLWPRNRIYQRVFDRKWIQDNLPEADIRRQREAYRRGVIRTTAVAASIVAALVVMMLIAVDEKKNARHSLAEARFSQARAWRIGDLAGRRHESLKALHEAHPYYTNAAALRDEVIACLGLVDLRERTNAVVTDAFALDVELGVLATVQAGAIAIAALKDGAIQRKLPGFGDSIKQLWLSRSKPYLIVELKDPARLSVWNWREGRQLFVLERGVNGRALDISRDENFLAVGVPEGVILVYELPTGRLLSDFDPELSSQLPRKAAAIRFNAAASLLAVSSPYDHFIEVWEVQGKKQPRRIYHSGPVNDLAWHPEGQLLAAACSDDAVYVWDINQRGKPPLKKLVGHEDDVISVAFSHRGDQIASLGKDATIRLWIPASDGHIVHRLLDGVAGELRFCLDDRLLVAEGRDSRHSRVWNVLGGEYSVVQRPAAAVHDFAGMDLSSDGRLLAAWNSDTVTIWDLETRRELAALPFTNISSACFSADAGHVLVSTDSGLLQTALQRHVIGTDLRLVAGPASRISQVTNELGYLAVTPDRTHAAVVWQTDVIVLALNAATASRRIKIGERFAKLAIHPQSRWVAGATFRDGNIYVLGCANSTTKPFRLNVARAEHFAFSPDGQWFAVCAREQFEFYSAESWDKPAFTIARTSPSDQPGPLAFSPDGRIVAIADARYHVQLYKIASGEVRPLATLESPDRKPLLAVAFSWDGRRLAALAKDQGVQLWNLELVRQGLAEFDLQDDWPVYSKQR